MVILRFHIFFLKSSRKFDNSIGIGTILCPKQYLKFTLHNVSENQRKVKCSEDKKFGCPGTRSRVYPVHHTFALTFSIKLSERDRIDLLRVLRTAM
jgi:hypothetical protein